MKELFWLSNIYLTLNSINMYKWFITITSFMKFVQVSQPKWPPHESSAQRKLMAVLVFIAYCLVHIVGKDLSYVHGASKLDLKIFVGLFYNDIYSTIEKFN